MEIAGFLVSKNAQK